ncbi:hypothetical protein Fcan01_15972 [Folsomia candida]|uniref:Uncharacterized protein n=1 Tax=Folsomia candida TaxID=158441 RepID=A0A226DXI9_FOLCA|nr:hypothetical protein Fcan01_15972 [Folsomia candida]
MFKQIRFGSQMFGIIVLWPVFAVIIGINEILRLIPTNLHNLCVPRESLDPDGLDNVVHVQHISNRVVVVALYTNQCLTSADLGHDYDKFRECIFNKRDAKGRLVYGKLRRTSVTRFGYGCHRNDAGNFQLANHVKFYSETTPQNGEFFTEDEFSAKICKNIQGASVQALPPYKSGPANQFMPLVVSIPLEGGPVKSELDITCMFGNVLFTWVGRLPVRLINFIMPPSLVPVGLNNIPFLKKSGSIGGKDVTEMAAWDLLYLHEGLEVVGIGYGDNFTVSGLSQFLEKDEVEELLDDLAREIQTDEGFDGSY